MPTVCTQSCSSSFFPFYIHTSYPCITYRRPKTYIINNIYRFKKKNSRILEVSCDCHWLKRILDVGSMLWALNLLTKEAWWEEKKKENRGTKLIFNTICMDMCTVLHKLICFSYCLNNIVGSCFRFSAACFFRNKILIDDL